MPRQEVIAGCLALLAFGCEPGRVLDAIPAPRNDQGPLAAPPRQGFEPVADALIATCGTLDCHGQAGRNLRLFGNHGLRLSAGDDPGGAPTSAEEYQASYWSVVGLEPETLDLVVRARAADPERLFLVRKPRGENHKGGTLMNPRDALDQCLLSWLAGLPNEKVCVSALPARPTVRRPGS